MIAAQLPATFSKLPASLADSKFGVSDVSPDMSVSIDTSWSRRSDGKIDTDRKKPEH
jgi:hypothetical protein